MPRLFTALEIPRNAAMSLSLLRGGLPGARWIDVENYHITLRFIGDVENRTADEIVDKLDRIERPEFQLQLTGTGAFGSKNRIRSGPVSATRRNSMRFKPKSNGSASGLVFRPIHASSRRM